MTNIGRLSYENRQSVEVLSAFITNMLRPQYCFNSKGSCVIVYFLLLSIDLVLDRHRCASLKTKSVVKVS